MPGIEIRNPKSEVRNNLELPKFKTMPPRSRASWRHFAFLAF
jgi:hypothetical protein